MLPSFLNWPPCPCARRRSAVQRSSGEGCVQAAAAWLRLERWDTQQRLYLIRTRSPVGLIFYATVQCPVAESILAIGSACKRKFRFAYGLRKKGRSVLLETCQIPRPQSAQQPCPYLSASQGAGKRNLQPVEHVTMTSDCMIEASYLGAVTDAHGKAE